MVYYYSPLRVIVWFAALFTLSVEAQVSSEALNAESAKSDVESVLTVEWVQSRLATIEKNSGIEDAVKDLLRPKYKEAIKSLKEAAEDATKATA